MHLMQFFKIKRLVDRARCWVWNHIWGMRIHPTAQVSLSAKLDKTHPAGVVIHERCIIAFGSAILTHDMTRRMRLTTEIGPDCFIGARSLILPGVRIGPNAIVAAGSVVTRDVEPGTIVAGNPAKVIQSGVDIGSFGRLQSALEHDGFVTDRSQLKG